MTNKDTSFINFLWISGIHITTQKAVSGHEKRHG